MQTVIKVATKPNLIGYGLDELQQLMVELGEKPYRAKQLLQWIHQRGKKNFRQMSNLSKALIAKLEAKTCIELPTISERKESQDGTIKWLLNFSGNLVEMVFIPETNRGTLCISSQIGCALDCKFCATGKQGFNRNLSSSEIIGQVWLASKELGFASTGYDRKITNVVFMGMGEPLLNIKQVLASCSLLLSDYAYGLSKNRVTVSTAGVVPVFNKLLGHNKPSLVISLHAPNDNLRSELVPLNNKYPLSVLMQGLSEFMQSYHRREMTFEYVMLQNVNDSLVHAKQLVALLEPIKAKINLIPFNSFIGTNYQSSSPERITAFRNYCIRAGIYTSIRTTRGDDISAACGQLAGKIIDRTKRKLAVG